MAQRSQSLRGPEGRASGLDVVGQAPQECGSHAPCVASLLAKQSDHLLPPVAAPE